MAPGCPSLGMKEMQALMIAKDAQITRLIEGMGKGGKGQTGKGGGQGREGQVMGYGKSKGKGNGQGQGIGYGQKSQAKGLGKSKGKGKDQGAGRRRALSPPSVGPSTSVRARHSRRWRWACDRARAAAGPLRWGRVPAGLMGPTGLLGLCGSVRVRPL